MIANSHPNSPRGSMGLMAIPKPVPVASGPAAVIEPLWLQQLYRRILPNLKLILIPKGKLAASPATIGESSGRCIRFGGGFGRLSEIW